MGLSANSGVLFLILPGVFCESLDKSVMVGLVSSNFGFD